MTERKKKRTMVKLLRRYVALLLLVVIFAEIMILFVFRKQVEQSLIKTEQKTLNFTEQEMESLISSNIGLCQNILVNNDKILKLANGKNESDRMITVIEIQQYIESCVSNFNENVNIFFYTDKLKDGYIVASDYSSDTESHEMLFNIKAQFDASDASKNYNSQLEWRELNGKWYVVYLFSNNGNAIGFWISADELLEGQNSIDSDKQYLILNQEGLCITQNYAGRTFSGRDWDVSQINENGSTYLAIGLPLNIQNMTLLEIYKKDQIMEPLNRIRFVLILIILALILVLICIAAVIDRNLYRPIRSIITTVEDVAEGDFETEVYARSPLYEVQNLSDSVNNMILKIKQLKVSVAEEEEEKNKATLQYLQMQIRPHFLSNSLNSIYSMIEIEEYDEAKSMCIHLNNYFRFLYLHHESLVTIGQELEQVQAYAEIQNIRYNGKIRYTAEVDEKAAYILVPPLTITTFVENSYKYGVKNRRGQWIRVVVTTCEDCVEICVMDSGEGFPEAVLQDLNSRKDQLSVYMGTGIGIINVRKRMSMVYHEKGKITFSNEPGACVRIWIPLNY